MIDLIGGALTLLIGIICVVVAEVMRRQLLAAGDR